MYDRYDEMQLYKNLCLELLCSHSKKSLQQPSSLWFEHISSYEDKPSKLDQLDRGFHRNFLLRPHDRIVLM